jgi:thymidylate synthase
MQAYHEIVQTILDHGTTKTDRTGTGTISISGMMFRHDMAEGFPLITTKKMPFKMIASELEFFIKGITDKAWLQERKNSIWNEWANPKKAPYGHTDEAKEAMAQERDLGPVYGFQWRHFGAEYDNYDSTYDGQGVDQLKNLVHTLKTNPTSRRMIVSAWNPTQMDQMALPPCHYGFQVIVRDDHLDLLWNQRSVDVMLGLPFNIASYGLLLHLLAKEANLKPGHLAGFLGDTHIYQNHIEGAKEQMTRNPNEYALPSLVIEEFLSIFDWTYTDAQIEGYESYSRISFPIAV